MKLLIPAIILGACLGGLTTTQAQLTINYDFTTNAVVPDNNGQLSDVRTLGGLSGLSTFNNVVSRLNLTSGSVADPMYLGDLYSSLTLGNSSENQRIAVLLNRAGRDNNNPDGSSLSSLNVTLDDTVASGKTNVFSATGNGAYYADGRLNTSPSGSAMVYANGTNGLGALNGATMPSNRVSLLVADYSQGGTATLSSWGISVTGTAASSGTFTPGANSFISDTGTGAVNNVGAKLDTTGAAVSGLVINLAGTTTLSGGVTGSGGLSKQGAGTLALSGTGNYTGITNVSGGTLLVNGNHTAATGSVTVGTTAANSGTLGGTGTIGGATTVVAGGSITGATVGAVGTLTLAQSLTINGTYLADVVSGSGSDVLNLTGTNGGGNLTLGDGSTLNLQIQGTLDGVTSYVLAMYTSLGGTFGSAAVPSGYRLDYGSTVLSIVPVPEPGTWLGGLLLLGSASYLSRSKWLPWLRRVKAV